MQRPSKALKGRTSSRESGDKNMNKCPDSHSCPLYLALEALAFGGQSSGIRGGTESVVGETL